MLLIKSVLLSLGVFLLTPVFSQVNQTDEYGRKQGPWVKKHDNGKVRYEGTFKDDKPVGTFRYYDAEGKLTAENYMFAFGTRANSKHYNPKGQLIAEGLYVNEKKDSVWNYYKMDTVLIARELYKSSKPHGTWVTWYENGKVAEEVTFKEGIQTGSYKQFFEDGTLKLSGIYVNGELEGPYVQHHSNGNKLVEGVYKKSLKVGDWKSYTEDGQLEYEEKYDDKGYRVEQKLINGKKTEYFDLVMLKSEVNYRNGKKNGPFKEYYESGEWKTRPVEGEGNENRYERYLEGQQVKVVGNYLNDQYHGKITWYNLDGTIEKIEHYQNGKKVDS